MSKRRRKRIQSESGASKEVTTDAEERIVETGEEHLNHENGSEAESSDTERSAGGDSADGAETNSRWSQYLHALLASNEFLFVD